MSKTKELEVINSSKFVNYFNAKLIYPLIGNAGLCSVYCDYWLYNEIKVAEGRMKPEHNYTDFISYVKTKPEKEGEKLEKAAKFLNVVQNFNNSAHDRVAQVPTIKHLEYDTSTFYDELQKELDAVEEKLGGKKFLKATFKGHDIIIFKTKDGYGYFNPNEQKEVKGLIYESFKQAFRQLVQKHGLLSLQIKNALNIDEKKRVLYIHDGNARIKAMLGNKEVKKALTGFFDSEILGEQYKKQLTTLMEKETDANVKNHMQILITRAEKFQKLLSNQNSTDNIIHFEHTKSAQQRYKIYKFDQYLKDPVALDKLIISDDLIKYRKAKIIKFLSNKNIYVKNIEICSLKLTQKEARFVFQNLNEDDDITRSVICELSVIYELEIRQFDQYLKATVEPAKLEILEISDDLIKYRKAEIIKFLCNNHLNTKDIEICSVKVTQEEAIFVLQKLKEGEEVNEYIVKNLVEVYRLNQWYKNEGIEKVTKLKISNILLESCKPEKVIASMERSVNVVSLDISALNNSGDIAPLISVAASKLAKLECLNVANNTLDDKSTAALIELIQNTKTLIALDISDIKLSKKNAEKLVDAIAKNNTIQLLDVSGMTVKDMHAFQRSLFIPIIEKNSSVKVMRARHCLFNSKMFLNAIAHNKSIEVLDLFYNSIASEDYIVKMAEANSNITEIRYNSMSADPSFDEDMLMIRSKAKKEQASSPSQKLENPVASTMETSKTVL